MEPMDQSQLTVYGPQNPLVLKGDKAREYASQDENLRILSKEIFPMALLNQTASLEDFYCEGVKLTVLNFTPFKIIFNKERVLYVNDRKISTFTKLDRQLIAYQVNGSPNLICFDKCYYIETRIRDEAIANPMNWWSGFKTIDKFSCTKFFLNIVSTGYVTTILKITNNDSTVKQIRNTSREIALKEGANLRNAVILLHEGLNDKQSLLASFNKDVISVIFFKIHNYLQFLDSEFFLQREFVVAVGRTCHSIIF